jgi:hypothetical protein
MPKPRRRNPKRRETMQRNAIISSFTPSMRLNVIGPNDLEPEIEGRPWLELRGTLVDPIRYVQDVVFKLWSDPEKRLGPARPAAVGYINGIRPTIDVAACCAPADFNYIWSLALSGPHSCVHVLHDAALRFRVGLELVILERTGRIAIRIRSKSPLQTSSIRTVSATPSSCSTWRSSAIVALALSPVTSAEKSIAILRFDPARNFGRTFVPSLAESSADRQASVAGPPVSRRTSCDQMVFGNRRVIAGFST